MRIIGGEARGRNLLAPEGMNTRPTQDHVRESLFNILQWHIAGTRTLDLFAGTGALSLEAVSRGAEEAVMSDCDKNACQCIRKNIENLRMQDRCTLFETDWKQAVSRLRGSGKKFDIVFLDPPYRMGETGEILAALEDMGLLAADFIAAVEHIHGSAPVLDGRFEAYDRRKYRETEITFVRRAANAGEGQP